MRSLRCSVAPSMWATSAPDLSSPTATAILSVTGTRPARRLGDRIESEIDCGGLEEDSIRRRVEPQPGGRVPALRADDRPLRRSLPELRLQALALKRDGLGRVQGVARGRPRAPLRSVPVRHGLPG